MLQARQRVHPEGSTGATPPPPPEEAPSEPEAYAEDTEERSSTATDSEIKQVRRCDCLPTVTGSLCVPVLSHR